MFNNSIIFISGGTGSWGQTLTKNLLSQYDVKKIICFSRNENQQVIMKRDFNNPKIQFIIGDVRDQEALLNATKNVDYIFHLAAMKHVPLCEDMPTEAIKTNITGTQNIINAAIQNKIKKVIYVSSDKAVEPINVYGMTKSIGEKLIIQANDISEYTKFVCIRGGNVMGSNGSVIPLFIDRMKKQLPITITDKNMTRFFLSLNEAINLLFKASESSIGGETFVMNMPACYITDLADVLMNHYGKVDVEISGIRPGEKLNEVLVSKNESTLTFNYDENYYVILPVQANTTLISKYNMYSKFHHQKFASNTTMMNKEEIKTLLMKGNFI